MKNIIYADDIVALYNKVNDKKYICIGVYYSKDGMIISGSEEGNIYPNILTNNLDYIIKQDKIILPLDIANSPKEALLNKKNYDNCIKTCVKAFLKTEYIYKDKTNQYEFCTINDEKRFLNEDIYENLNNKNDEEIVIPKLIDRYQEIETENQTSNKESSYILMNKEEIKDIVSDAQEKFKGQEEATKQLGYNLYLQQLLISNNQDLVRRNKTAILLEGPTGTGKTAIIKNYANKFNLPCLIEDINNYSSAGYKGSNLDDILVRLLDICKGDLSKAQRSIICFDEIDKLVSLNDKNNEIKMKTAVQDALLKFIEGNIYSIEYNSKKIEFDTTYLTIICMGAFTDIREKKNIVDNNPIGFNVKLNNNDINENNTPLTDEDFINNGVKRELIARLKTHISTHEYSKEQLKRILLESTISPLKDFEETLNICGKKPQYSEDFVDFIVTKAYELKNNCRSLQSILDNIQNSLVEELVIGTEDIIELTPDIINKKYSINKKNTKKEI